jgi:hypothetical protein
MTTTEPKRLSGQGHTGERMSEASAVGLADSIVCGAASPGGLCGCACLTAAATRETAQAAKKSDRNIRLFCG